MKKQILVASLLVTFISMNGLPLVSSLDFNHMNFVYPFMADDIDGEWQASQGYTITIKDGQGKLSSLGKTGFPQKLIGSLFYGEIQKVSQNTWKARRFQWKFVDNPEKGRWADEGIKQLVLSADKQTLTEGSRIFKRLATPKSVNVNNDHFDGQDLKVDYKGVVIRYKMVKLSSGKTVVHYQIQNTLTDVAALVIFKKDDVLMLSEKINPKDTHSGTIKTDDFDVEISYVLAETAKEPSGSMIGKMKELVRGHVSAKHGKLKETRKIGGVRG